MRTRTPILASALVLTLAAGPLAAPAFAADAPASATVHTMPKGPDAEALAAALAGLPDATATAALVRVGGTEGCGAAVRVCMM